MRVLQWHCNAFEFEAKSRTPVAEESDNLKAEYSNVLVCFICYEKHDEKRHDAIIKVFAENLKVDIHRMKPAIVLLYPYAHLSKNLGSPDGAKDFMHELEAELRSDGIAVVRAPFGWYKAFSLNQKGHPLAEAYREY